MNLCDRIFGNNIILIKLRTLASGTTLIPLTLYLFIVSGSIYAKDDENESYQQVTIAEPFIEFHTGPGRGYPIFFIVEKGDKITLIKKKTQWYKVESNKGKQGWVHEDQMAQTLTSSEDNFKIDKPEQSEFVQRDFEAGVLVGDFGGANVMTLFSGWSWTPNISTELAYSQALGNVSDSRLIDLSIMHQTFPEWAVSPYIKIGTGRIVTKPHATLVSTEDRKDEFVHAGLGFRIYLSRQFSARIEYNSYTILTSRNDNNETGEWKLGFSVFF